MLAALEQHLVARGCGRGGGALDDLALRADRLVELRRAALIFVLGALPLGLGLLGLAARGGDRGDPRVERVELGGDRGLVALDRALVGLQRRDLGLDPGAVHLLALDRDELCLGLADLARDIAELVLQHGAALADGRHFLLQRLQLLRELGELLRGPRGVRRERLRLCLAIAARAFELGVGGGDRAGVLAPLVLDGLQRLAALAERRVIERIGGDRGAAERDEVTLARGLAGLLLLLEGDELLLRGAQAGERGEHVPDVAHQAALATQLRVRAQRPAARLGFRRRLDLRRVVAALADGRRIAPLEPRRRRIVGRLRRVDLQARGGLVEQDPDRRLLDDRRRLRRDAEDRICDALLLGRVRERDAQLVVGIVDAAVELANRHRAGRMRDVDDHRRRALGRHRRLRRALRARGNRRWRRRRLRRRAPRQRGLRARGNRREHALHGGRCCARRCSARRWRRCGRGPGRHVAELEPRDVTAAILGLDDRLIARLARVGSGRRWRDGPRFLAARWRRTDRRQDRWRVLVDRLGRALALRRFGTGSRAGRRCRGRRRIERPAASKVVAPRLRSVAETAPCPLVVRH